MKRLSQVGSRLLRNKSSAAWEINLNELEKWITTYYRDYENRVRNGLAVFELWKKVKLCDLLYNKLKEWSAGKTDPEFQAARMAEHGFVLQGITGSVKAAVEFVKRFNSCHKNDKSVSATRSLINNLSKETDEGLNIAKNLERALNDWQAYLVKEIYGNQYKAHEEAFKKAIEDKMLEQKQIYLAKIVAQTQPMLTMNELSILMSLKQALISENKSSSTIEYLTLVAEDIDAVRHIPNIKKLTEIARQLLSGTITDRLDKKLFLKLFTEKTGEEFQHFGPLGVVGVKNLDMFDFVGSCNSLQYIFRHPETGKASTGHLSKLSKLTVGGATKENLNINSQAAYYCFVYPTSENPMPCEHKFKYEEYFPEYNLLSLFGGYAYFNNKKELVQLNAIHYNGENVYFGRKMQLAQPTDTIMELRKQGRLYPVTFSEVVAQGVELFAWLVPGEFDNANHGAFVFTFRDRNIPPCYFELVPHNVGSFQVTVVEGKENEQLGFALMNETLAM